MPKLELADIATAYTLTEAAKAASVSVSTMKRLIARGQIDVYRTSPRGRIYIPHRAVVDYLNRQFTPATRNRKTSA
jgi:excisionase family DNA binding protein